MGSSGLERWKTGTGTPVEEGKGVSFSSSLEGGSRAS